MNSCREVHGRLRSFAGVKRLRLGDKPEIESGRNVRTSHAQCQLKAGVRLYQHGEAAQNPYRRRDSRRKPPDPGEQSHQLQHASNCMFLIKFWQQGGGPSRIFENIWTRPFRTNNSPINIYAGNTIPRFDLPRFVGSSEGKSPTATWNTRLCAGKLLPCRGHQTPGNP